MHLEVAMVKSPGRRSEVLQQGPFMCERKVEAQITAVFPIPYLSKIVLAACPYADHLGLLFV